MHERDLPQDLYPDQGKHFTRLKFRRRYFPKILRGRTWPTFPGDWKRTSGKNSQAPTEQQIVFIQNSYKRLKNHSFLVL